MNLVLEGAGAATSTTFSAQLKPQLTLLLGGVNPFDAPFSERPCCLQTGWGPKPHQRTTGRRAEAL